MFISALDAKSGDVDDSLANPLASNLFDICIAFGVPLFIYTLFIIYDHFTCFIPSDSLRITGTFHQFMSLRILFLVVNFVQKIQVIQVKKFFLLYVDPEW